MYPVIRYRFNNIERRGTGSRHAAGRRGICRMRLPCRSVVSRSRRDAGRAPRPPVLSRGTHSRSRDCPPVSRLGPAYVKASRRTMFKLYDAVELW